MIVEIYADIVFLINFFVNGVILFAALVLCRQKAAVWRIALGSAAASALYTILIFTPLAALVNIFTSFVILGPGLFITLYRVSIRNFLIALLTAYVTAFALGGIALVSVYALGAYNYSFSTYALAMGHFTLGNLAVAIAVSFIVLKFIHHSIFKKAISRQVFCKFRIYLADRDVELMALVDTGNSLVDPISQSPVIIAEFEKIKPLLPKPITELFDEEKQDDLADLAESFESANFAARIRMIPYSAIGRSGVLTGFRPDRIEIIPDSRVKQKETKDVIIGICDFSLSSDGEYQALMNPKII